jgi:2',3'-cyclic-nucleotide 2'-phosphodiesterase (5'-nucleotidase family)
MRTIPKILLAALAATALFVPATLAETVGITFLLTSDIYDFDVGQAGRGGFARLNAVVKAERAKGGHVIYAHAGDMISPSLLSGIDKGANTVALLNLAAPDIFVPGNHEFDFGPDVFRTRMKELKSRLLAANLRDADGKMAEGFSDSAILDVAGVKVGILGITADDTAVVSSPGAGYQFLPSVETATAVAKDLRKQGAELIVGVFQTDRIQDQALLESHAFDLLLSGDDHTLDIHYDGRSALAESMTEANYVTAVDLTIDVQEKDGKRNLSWWPNFRIIDTAGVAPDPETQAAVAKYQAQLSKELDIVVGASTTPLDSRKASVRSAETAIGNLIADATRAATGADVAITNGGGIRGNKEYPAGTKLTRKDIFTELPFGNKTVKLEVTGETIWAALENGFSEVENGAGRFPQVSGLVVEADFKQAKGSRVLSVTIGGKPLDKAAVYTLATNDYMQGGGDGYVMFKTAKVLVDALAGKLLASDVMDFIAAQKEVAPAVEGRIKVKM